MYDRFAVSLLAIGIGLCILSLTVFVFRDSIATGHWPPSRERKRESNSSSATSRRARRASGANSTRVGGRRVALFALVMFSLGALLCLGASWSLFRAPEAASVKEARASFEAAQARSASAGHAFSEVARSVVEMIRVRPDRKVQDVQFLPTRHSVETRDGEQWSGTLDWQETDAGGNPTARRSCQAVFAVRGEGTWNVQGTQGC